MRLMTALFIVESIATSSALLTKTKKVVHTQLVMLNPVIVVRQLPHFLLSDSSVAVIRDVANLAAQNFK
jgi:hypothetical protein